MPEGFPPEENNQPTQNSVIMDPDAHAAMRRLEEVYSEAFKKQAVDQIPEQRQSTENYADQMPTVEAEAAYEAHVTGQTASELVTDSPVADPRTRKGFNDIYANLGSTPEQVAAARKKVQEATTTSDSLAPPAASSPAEGAKVTEPDPVIVPEQGTVVAAMKRLEGHYPQLKAAGQTSESSATLTPSQGVEAVPTAVPVVEPEPKTGFAAMRAKLEGSIQPPVASAEPKPDVAPATAVVQGKTDEQAKKDTAPLSPEAQVDAALAALEATRTDVTPATGNQPRAAEALAAREHAVKLSYGAWKERLKTVPGHLNEDDAVHTAQREAWTSAYERMMTIGLAQVNGYKDPADRKAYIDQWRKVAFEEAEHAAGFTQAAKPAETTKPIYRMTYEERLKALSKDKQFIANWEGNPSAYDLAIQRGNDAEHIAGRVPVNQGTAAKLDAEWHRLITGGEEVGQDRRRGTAGRRAGRLAVRR